MVTPEWVLVLDSLEGTVQWTLVCALMLSIVGVGVFIAKAIIDNLSYGLFVVAFALVLVLTVKSMNTLEDYKIKPIESVKISVLDKNVEQLQKYTPIWIEDNSINAPYYVVNKAEGKGAEVIVYLHCSKEFATNNNISIKLNSKI